MASEVSTSAAPAKKELTAQRVRELLDYDPDTGIFTWKVARRGTARLGAEAGTVHSEGYRNLRIDGRRHFAHRIAWLHAYGSLPDAQIDHRNRIRDDNRIVNLRLATGAQNQANMAGRSKSGLKGVYRSGNRWTAQIKVNRRSMHLGYFDTKQRAHAAYVQAALRLKGEFACVEHENG